MNPKEREKALAEARKLEKSGQLKSAYKEYLRAEQFQDAARLLANAGRPGDAGNLIMSRIEAQPGQVARLDPRRKKLAYLAATYLAKSELKDQAVTIFVGLGERSKAADILERAGDMLGAQRIREGRVGVEDAHPGGMRAVGGSAISKLSAERLEKEGKLDMAAQAYFQLKLFGDAARLLKGQGKTAEAADMYAQGGMPYAAAMCYLEVGDTGKGLDNLVRVPKSHARYREAAVTAVRVATELNVLSFQFEHFLTDFIASGPQAEREFEAFYQLSRLYEQHNLLENAKESLAKIIAQNPGYRDAPARLQEIERQIKGSAAVYERIRQQEASFRGERRVGGPASVENESSALPDLPDLPPPPQLTGLNLTPGGAPPPGAAPPGTNVTSAAAVDSTIAMMGAGAVAQGQTPAAVPQAVAAAPAPASAAEAFIVGNVIAERYRLHSEIGRGGMAVVFQAFDQELDEDIALKVFLQQVLDPKTQEESIARFKQELKLSRQLAHRNIIRLYDIGLHHGYRYISMELLRGTVLEDLLEGPMEFARGLAYLVQACEGLQAAHDKGVIHRDIKPDNLFVCEDEMVKVMDFGIAKNTVGRGLTMEGMTAGTPEYIAPEQISNFSDVSQAADQYALGMIAYKMFTGRLAFEHEELTPLLVMHLHQAPRPPRELNPQIPPELEQIILKLLSKKPEERFKNCRELAQHLQQIRGAFRR